MAKTQAAILEPLIISKSVNGSWDQNVWELLPSPCQDYWNLSLNVFFLLLICLWPTPVNPFPTMLPGWSYQMSLRSLRNPSMAPMALSLALNTPVSCFLSIHFSSPFTPAIQFPIRNDTGCVPASSLVLFCFVLFFWSFKQKILSIVN